MNLYDLDTPALIVDLDRLERNIARMATIARDGHKAIRPHTKTHKTPEIARMQVAAGAAGITVAKLGEADVMAEAGFDDIFVANQVVGSLKIRRLIGLARRARVMVGVDSVEVVAPISAAAREAGVSIPVRIEVDTGMHRAGLRTSDAVAALGQFIARQDGISLDGLFTYEGHANLAEESARQSACADAAATMRDAAAALSAAGIEAGHLSVGSTAGAPHMANEAGITELRAGVYVFNDRGQVTRGARDENCALTVLATVVSRPEDTSAIADAGSKSLSGDRGGEGIRCGSLLDDPEVVVDWMSEEHGHLDLAGTSYRPRVGDKVRIVPYHACTCTNMHDTLYGVRGENVEVIWTIAGRGRIQ